MTRKLYQFIGYDSARVPRVYGEGPTADVAETECIHAAVEYLARRPDTAPLDAWTFESKGARLFDGAAP